MTLTSEASLQILKPVETVYNGIVDPQHLTQYFISESSGLMETGKDLIWKFPEFNETFPITKIKVEKDKHISFVWDPQTIVNISLTAYANNSTVVKVTEGQKALTEDNLNWLISNVGGWSNFLASMKAYLEYGISLRKGAYEFMKT